MRYFKRFFTEKKILSLLLLLAFSVGLFFQLKYYSSNQLILYGDTATHLNMTRRVVDSLTPGMAQLGGTWLPLFHVLMLPLIGNDFLWHSGLAASIVNFAIFLLCAFSIYKVTFILTKNKWFSVLATILFIANPNVLYMQTTAMNGMLFILTTILCTYFLLRWIEADNIIYLIGSALFIFLTTMNRYEGWPVLLAAIIIVGIIALNKHEKYTKVEGTILVFSLLASLGIFLWLLWQLVIFNDPIYFLNSEYSAKTGTSFAIAAGSVPTYHNIGASVLSYFWAVANNVGIISMISAICGIVLTLVHAILQKKYAKDKKQLLFFLALTILLVPFVFQSFALYNGNIPIEVPQLYSGGTFNIRFGLYSLPAVIFFIIWFMSKYKYSKMILVPLIAIQLFISYSKPPMLLEAAEAEVDHDAIKSAQWMKENYDGGYILASETVLDIIIINTNTNLENYITESNQHFWKESMEEPTKYAGWVIISNQDRDMVTNKLKNKQSLIDNFRLVFKEGKFKIYKK